MSDSVKTRSDLISLLSEACELEHGLACSYLYSAFSLKQRAYDNDLTSNEFILTRIWAGQLYAIAAQEMMHLSQAWNLLSAIGGTPYYMRPNFPQNHKYYPIDLPLKLERFSEMALKRFIFYELPSHVSDVDYLSTEFGISADRIDQAFTVGKLYGLIRAGFELLAGKDLFIGNKTLQVGPDICDFQEIIKVTDLESARMAIDTIIEQGEGTHNDEMDCHFGLFLAMERQFQDATAAAKEEGRVFDPSRIIVENPVTSFKANISPRANPIKDGYTNQVAVLFDDVYSLMLRILQNVFQSGPAVQNQKRLSGIAIQLMVRVLKPLGESLTLLPFEPGRSPGAGAAFGLYRHVSLPADQAVANKLVTEGLENLAHTAKYLSKDGRAPLALINTSEILEQFIYETLQRV